MRAAPEGSQGSGGSTVSSEIVGRGSVGGESVGGGWRVGRGGGSGVFVAGTAVRVGLSRVEVGTSVGTLLDVAPGSRVRSVAVGRNEAVGVGVRVLEGVAVGIVDVMVGISDGVCVGAVAVGNGPSRALDVRASAVLVPAAPKKPPASAPGPRNANQIQSSAAKREASTPRVRKLDRLPLMFNAWFLFVQCYG